MKTNEKKGVTLIALVITIIVLLILAAISIGLLSSTGILEKANLAKQKTTVAEEIEQLQMIVAESVDDEGLVSEVVADNILAKLDNVVTEDTQDFPIEVKYTDTNNEYIIEENGEVIERSALDYDVKITFNAGEGNFINNSSKNTIKYRYKDVNKKQDIVKVLYTNTFDEAGNQIDTTSSPEGAYFTNTVRIEGASKLRVNIKHGKGTFRAIVSVPQAEPALWENSNPNADIEEFEIDGDTLNLCFSGGLGGLYDYYGYYATIKGIDSNGKIMQTEIDETERKLVITNGSYEIPTRFECAFRGWYKDKDCTRGNEIIFDEDGNAQNGPEYGTLVVYAKWAVGSTFKGIYGSVRTVCGVAGQSNYDPIPAKYFMKSDTAPGSEQGRVIEVQDNDSAFPIYMWYDTSTKTVYWYCQVKPKFNLGSMNTMFYLWKGMELIDLRGIDMSEVTTFSTATLFYSFPYVPLSKIIFDESFNGEIISN